MGVKQASTKTTDEYSNQYWRDETDNIHHEDGPAVIWCNGNKYWMINNKRHRIDGPAVMRARDGSQEWYVNGIDITVDVILWMELRNISWPWDESTQVEFVLTWG